MKMSESEEILNVKSLKLHFQKFELLDYLLFISILLISFAIGLYFSFRKIKRRIISRSASEEYQTEEALAFQNNDVIDKNVEELNYLVGNRKMAELPVAMSLIASFVSGISIIGLSTEIYMYGILFAYTIPTIIFAAFLCWYIFLPIFCDLKLTSIYEYFEMRYDKKIRLFGSLVNFIAITFWMPMVIYVPALVMNEFADVNIHFFCAIICIVCVFYTCLGGITAVIWTDVFQSFVMLSSIILIMILGIIKVGGLEKIFQKNYEGNRIELPQITLDPTIRYSLIAILVGGTISWTESTCCGQVMMQRFLSVATVAKARKVLIYYIIGIAVLISLCTSIGLILYSYYHNCDPLTTKLVAIKDQLLPLFIMEIFYETPGMNGIFMGGILSAVLSTLSTGLNSLAAIFLEDFLKANYSKPLSEMQTKIILRFIVILFGFICYGLVSFIENLGTIFTLSKNLSAVCGGPLFALFLMGVLMPWINANSALVGSSASFIVMAWICIEAHIENCVYKHKPLSVSECNYTFELEQHNGSSSENRCSYNDYSLYHISYLWYTPLGAFVTILVSHIALIFCGYNKTNKWKRKLIVTFLRKFVPGNTRYSKQLQKVETNLFT